MTRGSRLATVLGLLLLCSCPSEDPEPDGDGDADTDADADGDVDVDGDGDGDGDGDPAGYLDLPLTSQVEALDAGRVECAALTTAYLARIAERDEGPDGINALLSMAPEPLEAAEALDGAAGGGRPLHCGIVTIKDNIDMAGTVTSAGSLALADNLVDEDAPLVARLRAAGALIIAKANLSEWANFRGNGATSGWSSLGGQTLNGANPDYNPCGSSSGSAAAVAAGIVAAAIGTETDGSIVCPAAVNGVVGFKPTVGLVSRTGIVPISHTQDTAGPITRTVADAALLLSVMAGPDPADPATDAIPDDLDLDFVAALEGATLEGVRLGRVTTLTGYNPILDAVFDEAIERMEAAGATVVSVALPPWSTYGPYEMTVLLHEFKAGINDYLASHARAAQPSTLAELITWNSDHADEVMPYFGQELFIQAEATSGLDDPAYLRALTNAAEAAGEDGILAVLAAEDLDALVAPTTGPAWETNYETGDTYAGGAAGPAAVAGYPHATVPMGMVVDRPVGLSIFAGPWQDARVLALAHAFEALP